MVYVYPATIQHEEDGQYSIWFEDLPGCATSGETLADAIMMARDAMGGWLDCAMAHGDEIRTPSNPNDIALESRQMITLVDMDLEAYRRENDQRAIKPGKILRRDKIGFFSRYVFNEAFAPYIAFFENKSISEAFRNPESWDVCLVPTGRRWVIVTLGKL